MMEEQERVWELLEMCFYGHIDEVQKLLNEGVDVNSIWSDGTTPIKAARDGGNEDIVEFLLSIGAKDS